MSETVDILLATYQGARFLDEQLESILAQTYPHFHIRIRDDGSHDGTFSIIKKWAQAYPRQFTLLPTTERLGIRGNFSELMQNSQAPYAMFADQDDVWLPHKIEASLDQMKAMERSYGTHHPLAVHTDLKVVDRELNEICSSFWRYAGLNPDLIELNRLLPQNVLTGCTMLMNRPLVKLACPVPQAAAMHDWWVALTAACFGHIQYVEQPTILYRQHGGNDTGAKPYSLWYHLKNFKKSKNNISKTYQQAELFLSRYQNKLPADKKLILERYCELSDLAYLKKNVRVMKYQFFKQGMLRNIKMLLGV